jgi:hypothetical protein
MERENLLLSERAAIGLAYRDVELLDIAEEVLDLFL